MQKMEDQIKGLAYLSEADKERILKARGIMVSDDCIVVPEPSPKAQHKIEREDARKAEEKAFMERAAPKPANGAMKLHIDIHAYGKNGDAFHLEGDVYNTEDLAAIHDRFQGYMPRRKLWGIL